MTEQEATFVIDMIENHWQRKIEGSRSLWMEFLLTQDAELAVKAVGKLALSEGFMPQIKDMREMLGVVTPARPPLEAGVCATCHGDKVVLVWMRPAEESLWMKEKGLVASTESAHDETMPCPDCNAEADIDYHLLGRRFRPASEVTVRENMEPLGTDPHSPRTKGVPEDVQAWLEEKRATLLRDMP